jgi:hypothetical protein
VKRPSYEEAEENADERPAMEHTEILVFPVSPALFSVVWVKLVPQYVYCVSDVVPPKALVPILVTEFGIVSDVNELNP